MKKAPAKKQDSDDSDDSDSSSEEIQIKKAAPARGRGASDVSAGKKAAAAKAAPAKKAAKKEESSSDDSDSDSDDEPKKAPAKKAVPAAKGKAPAKKDSSSDSDGSEDEDSDSDVPVIKKGAKKAESSSDDEDDEEESEDAKPVRKQSNVSTRSKGKAADPDADKKELFVGNIPFSMSEDRLGEVFSEFGEVTNIKLPQQDGRPKGFGFVEFADHASAAKAIKSLASKEFDGRVLKLNFSGGKPPARDGGDFGGR